MSSIIGKITSLMVKRLTPHGAFLDGGELGDILVPKRLIGNELQVQELVEVFVHKDSEDRLIATLSTPKIQAGTFAFLKVTQTNAIGAFVDIGLDKELLIPFAEQHKPMEVDKSYLVYCFLNPIDDRLVGSSKIDRFLNEQVDNTLEEALAEGQSVDCIIGPSTELGIKVIINHKYWGLIHQSQVFRPLKFGQKLRAYVQAIRSDGKINVGITRVAEALTGDAQVILRQLQKAPEGVLGFNDKSTPESIKTTFGMSKAAFKRAIGRLYRDKIITIGEDIRLNEKAG